jgi:hypothetical protein
MVLKMKQGKTKIVTKRSIYNILKDHQIILVFASILIALISIYFSQRPLLEYAIISKEGTIMYQKGFGRYGLYVERKDKKSGVGMSHIYLLSFKKEPDYFEITTRKPFNADLTHIEPNKYMVRFSQGSYFGNSDIASDFKIQAY